MGSVRRATWRQYVPYLVLNVVVSAATLLLILILWGRAGSGPAVTPTPTLDAIARVASAIPTPSATVPPSPTPVTYTVQSGDTLGGIAAELGVPVEALMAANGLDNPDTLSVGQVLIVPALVDESGASPTPRPQPRASSTPAGNGEPPNVEIRGVTGAGDLEREAVRLLNTGGVATMAGWTLDDGDGNVYVFPVFTLHSGAVSVHSGAGEDTVIDLYWGLSQPVWTPGKIATLRNAEGDVQSTFEIPQN